MNNYKLLPALVSLLNTQNITKSAKEMNVTQSAMSKTLVSLRQAFADDLLLKQGNGFVLSERAEKLKLTLPSLLQTLDNLYVPTKLNLEKCSRTFALASSDYVAQFVLPALCYEVDKIAPTVVIDYQLWQKKWITEVLDRSLDLVSTIVERVPENLHGKKMAQDIQVIVMRSGHDISSNICTLSDYIRQKHIIISGGGDKDSSIEQALALLGKQRKVFASVPFFQTAMELLITSDSLLTMPLHIAASYSHCYDIVIKPLPLNIKPHQYYILWHAKYQHDLEHQWFRELCFTMCQKHLNKTIALGKSLLNQ